MPNPLLIPILGWLRRLSHPRLFMLAGALFAVTLVVPDPIPFVDELLLGLGTILLAKWKRGETRPDLDGNARRGR